MYDASANTSPHSLYSTRYKNLKSPLLLTFILFLVVCICYATTKPTENHAQYGFNVISGTAQSGPLTLILVLVQFAVPHAFIATASGFALSGRAIGGAFGSAVLNAIINGKIASEWPGDVAIAATREGLPPASVPEPLDATAFGDGF